LQSIGGVSLAMISNWTEKDLKDTKNPELKNILRHIKSNSLDMGCPEKYRAYQPALSGVKKELIANIVKPKHSESTKSKKIQSSVIDALYTHNLNNISDRKALIKSGWEKVKVKNGKDIEHWSFDKIVIEDHLKKVTKKTAKTGQGNPFTVFKIDDRSQACRKMWIKNIRIEYRTVGGKRYLGFRKGFEDGFMNFELKGRKPTINYSNIHHQSIVVDRMGLVGESTAEAHNFALFWYIFQSEIMSFLQIPETADVLLIGGHRFQDKRIGQVEVDATIAWLDKPINKQGRVIFENKGGRAVSSDWSDGFSIHQLIRPYDLIEPTTKVHTIPCDLTAAYCRFEKGSVSNTWNILLDIYEVDLNNDKVTWIRGIDFHGIPDI